MSLFKNIRAHWRRGTLFDALLGKLGIQRSIWRVKWYGTSNPDLAARALAAHAKATLHEDRNWVMSLGDNGPFHKKLNVALSGANITFSSFDFNTVQRLTQEDSLGVAAIYCGCANTREVMKCAAIVRAIPALVDAPFEYVSGLDDALHSFDRLDEYKDSHFVSPLLLDDPSPFKLYEESLTLFEQKCGLRDYLDLYQVIKTIVKNRVPGDIAEFGSYKGHSGWLIARTLSALGSDKHLYMFDAFESFPAEDLGIDKFWSRTHIVDFDEVRQKLEGFDNVSLVQGDFTQTLKGSPVNQIALAYIDCDSYRATRFLFDTLLRDGLLTSRGALVCEDYGHPALLGSRLAVHDGVAERTDLLQFFSQFSGLYIAFKA